jgi:transposase InsO family protein
VRQRHPRWDLPGRSTVCDTLSRNGLVPKKRNKRRIGHPGRPTSSILAPNDVWSADFKGQFKTHDGIYCYPLTVTDGYSRYLLGCQALYSTAAQGAKPVFTRLFREYGLPRRIRTDNGVPFATNTLARLSSLSAWWVRLGVLPELIEPGKPQQNGRHERMHKTLKAEATKPPAGNLPAKPTEVQSLPGGIQSGSCAPGNMSAWRRSTMASGTSTSGRSSSDGCTNATCASRTNMADY